MAAADGGGSAAVQLRLRGTIGDDELTCLRQQLAACLHSGVRDIRIHAEDQDDLDLGVLQALCGAHAQLARTGGRVTLLGARPKVRTRIAIHRMEHLLPSPQARAAVDDLDRTGSGSAERGG